VEIFPPTDGPVPEIDPSKPHPARIYDYGLGGKNHFAADRAVAAQVLKNMPQAITVARENRKFLGRAVRYLVAEAGVRQFLDVGAGLPTTENVHEVAQRVDPTARIVYVDNDPLVLVHARALLKGTPEGRTGYIHADLKDPAAILADPVTTQVLDFSEPIGLILVSVLPFLTDDDKPGRFSPPCSAACHRAATSRPRTPRPSITQKDGPPPAAPTRRLASRGSSGSRVSSPGWRLAAWVWCRPASCLCQSGARTTTARSLPRPK
jgi:hypothetical protein